MRRASCDGRGERAARALSLCQPSIEEVEQRISHCQSEMIEAFNGWMSISVGCLFSLDVLRKISFCESHFRNAAVTTYPAPLRLTGRNISVASHTAAAPPHQRSPRFDRLYSRVCRSYHKLFLRITLSRSSIPTEFWTAFLEEKKLPKKKTKRNGCLCGWSPVGPISRAWQGHTSRWNCCLGRTLWRRNRTCSRRGGGGAARRDRGRRRRRRRRGRRRRGENARARGATRARLQRVGRGRKGS